MLRVHSEFARGLTKLKLRSAPKPGHGVVERSGTEERPGLSPGSVSDELLREKPEPQTSVWRHHWLDVTYFFTLSIYFHTKSVFVILY